MPENEASNSTNSKLNWLRAAVLGSNDGIVSVASIVVGVAGAITDGRSIFISGIAGLAAGALSMATGEYVSVSSQRDVERDLLNKESHEQTNPLEAALASGFSFVAGGIIPLFAIALPPAELRIPATFGAAVVALTITGVLSARASGTKLLRPTVRVVLGGIVAMIITYGIGLIFGTVGL